jgi:hypothetical protein
VGSVETPTARGFVDAFGSNAREAGPSRLRLADVVKQFIDYFIAHAPVVEIVVNGAEIIILDSRVLHDNRSVIWTA